MRLPKYLLNQVNKSGEDFCRFDEGMMVLYGLMHGPMTTEMTYICEHPNGGTFITKATVSHN